MPGHRFSLGLLSRLLGPRYLRPRTAPEALERLKQGNRNFVRGQPRHPHASRRRREYVAREGQHPFALVVACSDSREAPELLFDCGLGDLFAVRTAGQVVGTTALASVEFGVLQLGVRLVVVLGHSGCGAVAAAIAAERQGTPLAGHLGALIGSIAPCVREVGAGGVTEAADAEALAEAVLRRHVARTVQAIRETEVLRGVPDLLVIGGRYDIASGEIDFFVGPPEPPAS